MGTLHSQTDQTKIRLIRLIGPELVCWGLRNRDNQKYTYDKVEESKPKM